MGAVQAVQVEVPRQAVGGGHQRHSAPQQRLKQPAENHCIGHIRHLELVKAQ